MKNTVDYSKSFLGTVVRNSNLTYKKENSADVPDGRVLVKIDSLSPSNRDFENFKFPLGDNVAGALDKKEMDILDVFEFLCYVGAPVTGSDGVGFYCSKYGKSTTSESNDDTLWTNEEDNGFAPADIFKNMRDSFCGLPDNVGVPCVNTYGAAYCSDYRSNQAKGTHAVPGVGARVVVQFLNGNRKLPFISHVLHSTNDISNIRSTGEKGVFSGYPFLASNM